MIDWWAPSEHEQRREGPHSAWKNNGLDPPSLTNKEKNYPFKDRKTLISWNL